LFQSICKNLKRAIIWNSLEVHAIYGFFYNVCTSREGLQQIINYFSAEDPDVFDPVFIAQYLLAPINTIVKTFEEWMLEAYLPPSESAKYKINKKI
jgi:hypothetical protein